MTTKLNNFKAERMLKNIIGESFSTNIYAELSIENLKKEYNKTMLEILDFSVDKDRPIFFQNPIKQDFRAYFRGRLLKKLNAIKTILKGHIKTRGLRPGLDDDRYCGWVDGDQINSE